MYRIVKLDEPLMSPIDPAFVLRSSEGMYYAFCYNGGITSTIFASADYSFFLIPEFLEIKTPMKLKESAVSGLAYISPTHQVFEKAGHKTVIRETLEWLKASGRIPEEHYNLSVYIPEQPMEVITATMLYIFKDNKVKFETEFDGVNLNGAVGTLKPVFGKDNYFVIEIEEFHDTKLEENVKPSDLDPEEVKAALFGQ